ARLRGTPRVRRICLELAGCVLVALARVRPDPGCQVVRLPPRGLHDLPRRRAGRRRADRPVEARSRRKAGRAKRGGVRGAVLRGERHGPRRRRRVRKHAVGLRPAPRSLRLLPRPAVARGSRGLARGRAATARRGVRDRSRDRSRAPSRAAVHPARERCGDRHRSGSALASDRIRPRRFAVVALPLAVAGSFAAMSWFAWERIIEAPEDKVFAGGLDRAWIDDRIPHDASVTKLYIDTSCGSSLERHALFLTEFFNETVDRAVYVNGSVPDGIPLPSVDVTSSGLLELAAGEPLHAEYVFTQPGLELEGRRIAEGTAANLVLWRTDGPVRVVGASSNDALRRAVCLRTGRAVSPA